MFPLDYRNKIEITHINQSDIINYQKRFLTEMSEELRIVKASEIQIQDSKISFWVASFRFVHNWNILVPIDSGYIEVLPSSKSVVISYYISFKRLFISATVLLILFGIILVQDSAMSLNEKVFLLLGGRLFVVGGNLLIAMIRIHAFIKRIVRKVDSQIIQQRILYLNDDLFRHYKIGTLPKF
jgi:hypothetical protein